MNLLSVITEWLGFVGDLFCSSQCRLCRGFCIRSKTALGALKTICQTCWCEITAHSPQVNWLSLGRTQIPVASGCYYAGRTKKLIYHLKYDGDVRLAEDLSLLLNHAWSTLQDPYSSRRSSNKKPGPELPNYLIVPIPMHQERYRQRGYNQAELLANRLASYLNTEVVPQALTRIINTIPQYGLSRKQRKENLRGAFLADAELVKGREILIVDDIFTSGATISEAASELLRKGATSIRAVTLARAL
jgi:ComF family protein